LSFTNFELDPLSLFQCPVAGGLDSGPVDEDIGLGLVNGDEAVALFPVEPFDDPLRHTHSPLLGSAPAMVFHGSSRTDPAGDLPAHPVRLALTLAIGCGITTGVQG